MCFKPFLKLDLSESDLGSASICQLVRCIDRDVQWHAVYKRIVGRSKLWINQ